MPEHDFDSLYARYPDVISQMKDVFTTHQFILKLAQQNQTLYIEALYDYRHREHRGVPAPFLMIHAILAQHLTSFPHLIQQIRQNAPSKDIFGHDNTCSEWRKFTK